MTRMPPNGRTEDACTYCGWPWNEHELDTERCPDYSTDDGWRVTTYEGNNSNA